MANKQSETEPDTQKNTPKKQTTLVGIGASAGGLEALRELVTHLPTDLDAAYLVAQHLSPSHSSMLPDLLMTHTELKVVSASNGAAIKSGHIYITPPNFDLGVADDKLALERPTDSPGPHPSVDHMFASIAAAAGEHCIGVVLSGTGSDGAFGVRAVKAAGGTVLVQEPSTAKYDGMPRAAALTGCADRITQLPKMGKLIGSLIKQHPDAWTLDEKDEDQELWQAMTGSIRKTTGLDFNHYKPETVNRRIAKRMGIAQLESQTDYAKLLLKDPGECKALVRDMLISVTEFFRDTKAFDALRDHLHDVLKSRTDRGVFRIWVPGCATGEEAYSLAILLAEINAKLARHVEYLIFATDLDTDALEIARAGVYPERAVQSLPEDIAKRHFKVSQGRYVISSSIRQCTVFAPQNVVDDPPFSRVDLISCRNLLIYFNRETQSRVLDVFHYALVSGGTLFLGNSEAIETHRSHFAEVNRRARVYTRKNSSRGLPRPPSGRAVMHKNESMLRRTDDMAREATPTGKLLQRVVESHCPPMVIVDADDQALHFFGDVRRFLKFPSGPADFDIFDMVDPSIRAEMRALLHRSRRKNETVEGSVTSIGGESVRPIIRPLQTPDDGTRTLVFRTEKDVVVLAERNNAPPEASERSLMVIGELESELAATRMRLQTVVEELETSNEELQSQSEELQSANEEMQSTNEELQTSNEELQSTNEELLTLNEELKNKSEEVEATADALTNVKESIEFPLFVIDNEMRVEQFNAHARSLCLHPDAMKPGVPLVGLNYSVDLTAVIPAIRQTLDGGTAERIKLTANDGATYDVVCTPYVTGTDKILGAVISLVDVSLREKAAQDIRDALNALSDSKERTEITLSSINDGVITTDNSLSITYLNPAGARLLGVHREDSIGKDLDSVFKLRALGDDQEAITDPARRALAEDRAVSQSGRCLLETADDQQLAVECSAAPLKNHAGSSIGSVLAFRDVTSNHLLTEELSYRATHDPLTGLINRDAFESRIESVVRELRQEPNSHVLMFLDLDQFKIVNDTAGHAAGDELLKQVCAELRSALRQSDVLARLGGDEFGIVLRSCELERAKDIADDLLSAVRAFRFVWGEQQFSVGVSIGMVVLDQGGWTVADAFSAADAACYVAKEEGRNRVHVADGRNDAASQPRLSDMHIVNRVKSAMDDGRLSMFVEFVASATQRDDYRYRELLLRMTDEDGTLLEPAQFVPAAERYYLMSDVDRHVLVQAVALLERETAKGKAFNGVTAINISGQSIGDQKFLEFALNTLRESSIDPSKLCFEITETAAISRLTEAVGMMRALKKLNCQFALDDFGAGMSSFSYLRTLPVDFIKIDGSFVHNMARNVIDRTMIEAVATIGRELDLITIAEYVGTPETAAQLAKLGVDLIQGELVGLAQPLD